MTKAKKAGQKPAFYVCNSTAFKLTLIRYWLIALL